MITKDDLESVGPTSGLCGHRPGEPQHPSLEQEEQHYTFGQSNIEKMTK